MDLPRSGHNLKIIAIANQKGGIVKATSAVNIDAGLTRSKKLCLQN
jgi:cellulose biosynthesis protein BcsQ